MQLSVSITVVVILLAISTIHGQVTFDGLNWSIGCDFQGNDIEHLSNTRFEDCEPRCIDTPGCTHFTWMSDICVLKTGQVFVQDAFPTYDDMICGYVENVGGGKACRNMWDISESEYNDPTADLSDMCPG